VLTFEPTASDPYWRLLPFFWLPDEGLKDKATEDNVDYLTWRRQGWLETTKGKAISRLKLLHRLVEICSAYDVQAIGYDRWRIEDLNSQIEQENASLPPMVPVGSSNKDMTGGLEEFERRLITDELRHNGNPVMTWCAANAVTDTSPEGYRKINKRRATGRVDGIVAAILATSITIKILEDEDKKLSSHIEQHGLRRL